MKTYFCSLLVCLLFFNIATGQTTWTGAIDQNWHNAANWSNGLPAPGNDAFVPDVVNDPVISEGSAFDFNIALDGSMTVAFETTINQSMNISSAGVLNLAESLSCKGHLSNHGTINFIAYLKLIDIDSNAVVDNYGVIYNAPFTYEGSLSNHGIINNYESGIIYVNHHDIYGIANFNLVLNYGLITGVGYWNSGEFINYGTVDIIEDRNQGNVVNHGNFFFSNILSSIGNAFYHNTECGYLLKRVHSSPNISTIDLNDGIVVDLDSKITIVQNNGMYSLSLIPDTTIITCFDTVVYLDNDGLVTLSEEMLFTNFGCNDTIVLMSNPNLDCSNVNEQVEIQIGYLVNGEPTYQCSAQVTVLDTTPPYLIDSLGIFYHIPPGGGCAFTVVLIPPLAADNCDLDDQIFGYEFFPSLESLSPGDTFTIIYSTEDNSGNAASFSATRVVPLDLFLDVTIVCPGDVELEQTPFCPVGLFWDEPVLTNTCNILSTSSNLSSGDTLLPGTYLAFYEYTDLLDTVHACTFNIVVVEQDTVFETATICEGGVLLLPWNGVPITDPGLYCYTDSICMTTQCLEVMLIPTITTEYDTMICPNGLIAPGTYVNTLVSAMGCDSIVIVHVFSCTAVEDLSLKSAIRVYPNPATHTVSIACESIMCIGSQFEFIDVTGNVIEQGLINDEKTEILVSLYSAGVVMIKITNGRQSIVEKIIILPD